MKIVRDDNQDVYFENSNINLEKIINFIENDNFEIARNHLNILIEKNIYYSDAYVFRFLTNMYLNNFEEAAKDFMFGLWMEKNKKFIYAKYCMADVVKEYWFNSSLSSRNGLKNALRDLGNRNMKIVK